MVMPRSEKQRKELLGAIVQQELTRAEGGEDDALQSARATAQQFYDGVLPDVVRDDSGDPVLGLSGTVSTDVADCVNANLALLREMAITDAELVVEAEGTQDQQAAQAESDVCTDVLMRANAGETILVTAIKDALLLKNGCTKVRMVDGDCIVQAVPIENISYTSAWAGSMEHLPFFSEYIRYTRSDLVEMGISKSVVDELQSSTQARNATSSARNVSTEENRWSETRDQEPIDCYEAYVLADMNGDGISERYRCLVANKSQCLEFEEVERIPYALGSPFISPHRLTGESLFDRVAQLQVSNTAFLRQWENNVSVINNGRYVYDPSATTEEDVLNPTAGGGIRARNPGVSVIPVPVPDIGSGIQAALEFNKRRRSEAGGAALDMASAQAQIATRAATAAAIDKGNQEIMASMIASNITQTLVLQTYKLIHYYLREFSDGGYVAVVAGVPVEVDPSQWPEKRRMFVRSGLSPSIKAMQQQALGMHVQAQAQAMAQGMNGIIASPITLHRTQSRYLKASGVLDPENLMVDPSSPEAQQAAQMQQQAQQAQQQAAMQAAQQAAQLEKQDRQTEAAKIAEDARQFDAELQFKYYEADLKADVSEAQTASQGVIDLEKQRMADSQAERQRAADAAQSAANTGTGS